VLGEPLIERLQIPTGRQGLRRRTYHARMDHHRGLLVCDDVMTGSLDPDNCLSVSVPRCSERDEAGGSARGSAPDDGSTEQGETVVPAVRLGAAAQRGRTRREPWSGPGEHTTNLLRTSPVSAIFWQRRPLKEDP
jgi:hypothetical protein